MIVFLLLLFIVNHVICSFRTLDSSNTDIKSSIATTW